MTNWLRKQDRNELTYWVGLAMLFIGLCFSVSVATALAVAGGAMALESVLTSYIATWMSEKTR